MIAANVLLLLAREELSVHNATGAKHYTASAIKVRISSNLIVPAFADAQHIVIARDICIDHQRQYKARMGADMAEPSLERDSEQPRQEQPHGDCVW